MPEQRQPYPSRIQILEQNLRDEHLLVHRLQDRLEKVMSDNRIYARWLVNTTLNLAAISNPTAAAAVMDWVLDNADGKSSPLLAQLTGYRIEQYDCPVEGFKLAFVSLKTPDDVWTFLYSGGELQVIQSGTLVTD